MRQLSYRVIYNPFVNKILRNINKSFRFLNKRVKLPPSGEIKFTVENKHVIRLKTNQTNYVTYLIFWEGWNKFEFSELFVDLVKKIDVFYDIGANIGYYSLLAATVNERIKVVGFEPANGPLHYFKMNKNLNKLLNINIEPIAISQKTGYIEFYEQVNNKYHFVKYHLGGENNAGSKVENGKFITNMVKTETLDNYVKEREQQTIDLIKIDTEGTENLILSESHKILSEMKPIVICETLFNKIEPELEKIFNSYNYEFYNHTEKGLEKVKTIIRDKDNGVRNCFFVHPEKTKLIEKFVV